MGLGLILIGNAPLPDGLRRILRGAEPGGGITIFVCPVKFSKSVVASPDAFGFRGVGSSSSFEEVLRRDEDNNRSGRCAVPGVPVITDVRRCLEGDHASQGGFEGELRRLAKRVMSVGIAEMVLRSPTVSSWTVLSSKLNVKVN